MKHTLVLVLLAITIETASAQSLPQKRNLIPSWGDICLVYGPGTDSAMDTDTAMENTVRHWKGRGFTGVYLRTDLTQFLPESIIRHQGNTQPDSALALSWHIIDEVLAKNDPHVSLRKASDKLGFEYWMFHPHIYAEGAPVNVGVPGPGRMVPWSYMRKYHQEHPEVITIDREGNRQWMVPEYGYPGARADKVAEFAHLARTYHPTGIIASMRSESSQLIPPPDHADQYGFNPVVVDEMKHLYGVDIMTDPRFDWKSATFNSNDPMLENWRTLRGTYITQLYREIRNAIRAADPKVKFAVSLSGEHVGPVMGNAKLDWRTWIEQGIVDVILLPSTFEATLDLESEKKGYLTDVRAGKGLVTVEEVKKHVLKSPHPEIQVIQTGASSYFYSPAPSGADGWQCDAWYDSYHVAWYQRWQQWRRDLADFGYIKFFDQNFDQFPVKNAGISGGLGDGRYHPEMRSCPGLWMRIGDGSDDRPFVQQEVRRSDSGSALAFTGKDASARHYSSPDRSLLTGQLDTAIVNGSAELSFWVYRETEQTSMTVYFSGNANYEKDVAVRIAPKTGLVSCVSGTSWVPSEAIVPTKQWSLITMKLNLDARTYSLLLNEKQINACSDIPFAPPAERTVVQHGVNIPIKVPSYRIFNVLMFLPTEGTRDHLYMDDLLVKWKPTLHYAEQGSRKLLDVDFESAKVGSKEFAPQGNLQAVKSETSAQPFFVEQTTSFGAGVHCARANGGGVLESNLNRDLSLENSKGLITIDLDLFIRSDLDFPYMIPNPTTRSPHNVVIGIEGGTSDQPLALIDSAKGFWRLWDGSKFVETDKLVHYDVWNHLQIAIDPMAKTYRLIVQPVGELPTIIGQATCGLNVKAVEKLKFSIKPSATPDHISCYDNIIVTSH